MTNEPKQTVVDQAAWLMQHIEELLAVDDAEGAKKYLERLLVTSSDPFHRAFCLKHLGRFALREKDLDTARLYLRRAAEIESDDPVVRHAIGETAGELGGWWIALVNFLEAIHRSDETHDLTKFMQSAALAFEKLDFGEVAMSVLLGALDRSPEDPFLLTALERMYETQEQWLKAREIKEALFDLVSHAGALELEDQTKKLEQISQRMRDQFTLVTEDYALTPAQDQPLSPVHFPSGLHTLVNTLGMRERNLPLLASAQVLWAKAKHDQYDVHLTTATLAASIHWIVERLHWRIPTSVETLETLYGADRERMLAAVRVIVGRFQVEIFPSDSAMAGLPPGQLERLRKLQRAVLFGVGLDEVEISGALG